MAQPAPAGQFSGVYLHPFELAAQWERYFGVPISATFGSVDRTRQMLSVTARDAKNIGFNALVVSSYDYPGLTRSVAWPVAVPYSGMGSAQGFIELAAQAASEHNLALVVALSPQGAQPEPNSHLAWAQTCEDSEWSRREVQYFRQLPAVTGILCAFEGWGALPQAVTPSDYQNVLSLIGSLKSVVESNGLYFLNVPSAGNGPFSRHPPFSADLFTRVTAQLNPRLYPDPETMDQVVQVYSRAPTTGVEMSIWHQALLNSPLARLQDGAAVPSMSVVEEWNRLQRNAVLRFRPRVVTWEDYERLAFPSTASGW